MLELADEVDSKSIGLITRAGSSPATGREKRDRALPRFFDVSLFCFKKSVMISLELSLHISYINKQNFQIQQPYFYYVCCRHPITRLPKHRKLAYETHIAPS